MFIFSDYESFALCRRAFRENFSDIVQPNRHKILTILHKFNTTGLALDIKSTQRHVLTEVTINDMRAITSLPL